MFKKKRKSRSKVLKYKQQHFQTQRKKRKKITQFQKTKRPKPLLLIIISLLIIASIIYLIYFSSLFKIKEIKIKNAKVNSLNQKIIDSLSKNKHKNILTINTTELEEEIKEKYEEIDTLTITKKLPSKLEVEFKDFPATANIINKTKAIKKSYVINQIGYIIKEDAQNKNLPYIKINSDEPINKDGQLISEKKLNYILNSIKYFQDKFGMNVIEVEYKINAREIHLLTEKNFYIWLDINKPYETQLQKLKKILVKLDIYSEPLEYIDLRIEGNNGEKIIYKRK